MKEFFTRIAVVFFLSCSILVTVYILLLPPRPGVADQGDFQRVMDVTGLQEKDMPAEELNSLFFKYVKSEYIMIPVNPLRFFGIIPATSMIYPVTAAKILCRISGSTFFNTEVLAVVYAIFYITAVFLCFKWCVTDKNPAVIVISALLSLIILFDGNYLVWFNSLYGEPMMITGLIIFIASVLNVSNKIHSINNRDILFVVISSFLFLGSKAQCISALPFVILLILRTFSIKYKFRYKFTAKKHIHMTLKSALLPVALLIFYTLGYYIQINRTCGVDTKFNSVFYGILKNSDDPERDLQILGLNTDMAAEAGKHAYLPRDEYKKYVPWSDITKEEFNKKISNFKIIRFYLMNPKRLIQGMEYTASQSFQTSTFLGKYKKTDIEEYTYKFDRFTLWSDFRSSIFPGKLWFILSFYILVLLITVGVYLRSTNPSGRLKIELIWFIAATGIFQFPMPYLGNGEADTAKQLFLFNYTFDILIIVLFIYMAESLVNLFKNSAKHIKYR